MYVGRSWCVRGRQNSVGFSWSCCVTRYTLPKKLNEWRTTKTFITFEGRRIRRRYHNVFYWKFNGESEFDINYSLIINVDEILPKEIIYLCFCPFKWERKILQRVKNPSASTETTHTHTHTQRRTSCDIFTIHIMAFWLWIFYTLNFFYFFLLFFKISIFITANTANLPNCQSILSILSSLLFIYYYYLFIIYLLLLFKD